MADPKAGDQVSQGTTTTAKPLNQQAADNLARDQQKAKETPKGPPSEGEAKKKVEEHEKASSQPRGPENQMNAPLNKSVDTVHGVPNEKGKPSNSEEEDQQERSVAREPAVIPEPGGPHSSTGDPHPGSIGSVQDLSSLLEQIFGAGTRVAEMFRRQVEGLLGSSAVNIESEHLARSFTKMIDGVIDVDTAAATLDERTHLAQQMASNGAAQLRHVADLLEDYPNFQRAVAEAKIAAGGQQNTKEIFEARQERRGHQDLLRQALENVDDAIAGQLKSGG